MVSLFNEVSGASAPLHLCMHAFKFGQFMERLNAFKYKEINIKRLPHEQAQVFFVTFSAIWVWVNLEQVLSSTFEVS